MEQIEQIAAETGWEDLLNDYYYSVGQLQMAKERAKIHRRTSVDLYRNTAGEIEARDVTARRSLTPEQRRSQTPARGDENTVFTEDGDDLSLQLGAAFSDENEIPPENVVRYSMDHHSAQGDITAQYQATVDQILSMKNVKQDHLVIGYTPDIYTSLGMPSLPFVIGTGHVYSAAKTEAEAKQDGNYRKGIHYHGLGSGTVKNIYQSLKDPVMIIASKDVDKKAAPMRSTHSIVAIVDIGSPMKSLLLPVEITAERSIDSVRMDVNALSSVYERNVTNLVNEAIAIENTGDIGIYYAKKEALTLPGAGVQFPVRLQQSIASNGIIHRFPEKVNMKISNVVQSQQFKRWFGDWQNNPENASKIVGPDGAPRIMYHGTKVENGEFFVFDASKAVKKGGLGLWAMGKGNYFTAKKLDGTERYGARVIPAYLNIRNPFVFNGGNFYDQVVNALGLVQNIDGDMLQQKMRENGYDGVVQYDKNGEISIAVTFDSVQIKSATDNIGTFDGKNPDIRYSVDDGQVEQEDDIRQTRDNMTIKERDILRGVETRLLRDIGDVLGANKFTDTGWCTAEQKGNAAGYVGHACFL